MIKDDKKEKDKKRMKLMLMMMWMVKVKVMVTTSDESCSVWNQIEGIFSSSKSGWQLKDIC